MTAPLAVCHNVSKTYQFGGHEVRALDQVSIELAAAQMTALVGPSGSGKSTLLNLLGALDVPTSGSLRVGDTELGQLKRHEQALFRQRSIGFIFQSFNLIPILTAEENVMLPGEICGAKTTAQVRQRAIELLIAVGLEQHIKQPVNRLSGGQMQRVAIARSLINEPLLILADEPTANLDHDTATTILNLLKSNASQQNVAVAIATHDQHVLQFCDHIIRLRSGKRV